MNVHSTPDMSEISKVSVESSKETRVASPDECCDVPSRIPLDASSKNEVDSRPFTETASTNTISHTQTTSEESRTESAETVVRKSCITIDHAKTNRAICRTCNQTIQHGTLRCGVESYAGGRISMQCSHVDCFINRIRVEYCSSRRGKCKGSGEAFVSGSVRVGFEVGVTRSWWCIREAAKWTKRLVDEGKRIESVLGLDSLEPDHRVALLSMLNGEAEAASLHKTCGSKATSRTKAKSSSDTRKDLRDKPSARSTSSDDIEIHTSRSSDNDVELIASLRQ
mmetsp:Transcript_93029/g.146139  ORF Transcript_93029/g.146139 Transcript_93029/m.146139 type:complete len:281 (+) Transcript_93029:3-845(+)